MFFNLSYINIHPLHRTYVWKFHYIKIYNFFIINVPSFRLVVDCFQYCLWKDVATEYWVNKIAKLKERNQRRVNLSYFKKDILVLCMVFVCLLLFYLLLCRISGKYLIKVSKQWLFVHSFKNKQNVIDLFWLCRR